MFGELSHYLTCVCVRGWVLVTAVLSRSKQILRKEKRFLSSEQSLLVRGLSGLAKRPSAQSEHECLDGRRHQTGVHVTQAVAYTRQLTCSNSSAEPVFCCCCCCVLTVPMIPTAVCSCCRPQTARVEEAAVERMSAPPARRHPAGSSQIREGRLSTLCGFSRGQTPACLLPAERW